MKSEYDPRIIDKFIAEESEKFLRKQSDLDIDFEKNRIFKEFQESNKKEFKTDNIEDQRKFLIAMSMSGLVIEGKE